MHLFTPNDLLKSPIKLKRIGYSRTTVLLKDGVIDFKQDNSKVKGDYPLNGEWTGKTFFRVYGLHESDYNVESMEIREAVTDYEFVGREKEGEGMISMFSPQSIKGVFVEDNQATIRILENGKSPTFRHTDKTQGINLSWLEEQFKRRWYKLLHGSSILQAADILTKPFVNAEKWKFAVHLLAISPTTSAKPSKALANPAEVRSVPQEGKAWQRWRKLGERIWKIWIRAPMKDASTNQIQGFPKTKCHHPICQYNMVDGHLKCLQCHRQIEPVTDANVATQAARREATARTKGGQGHLSPAEEGKILSASCSFFINWAPPSR